jgi:hypothetical protein
LSQRQKRSKARVVPVSTVTLMSGDYSRTRRRARAHAFMRGMRLSDKALEALDVVRREGRALRYVVDEICHSSRYRLSVRYQAPAGGEIRLGLLYSADRVALEELGERLAAGETPRS